MHPVIARPEADPIADVAPHEGSSASLWRRLDQVTIDDLVARGQERGVKCDVIKPEPR